MRVVAVIPAKGHSVGVPGKNKKPMLGKPLFLWSVEQALAVGLQTYVSSDDPEILHLAERAGAIALTRPSNLCLDSTSTEAVVKDAVSQMIAEPHIIVLLQPTNPCRRAKDIKECLAMVPKYDSILSVVPSHRFLWMNSKSLNYDYN